MVSVSAPTHTSRVAPSRCITAGILPWFFFSSIEAATNFTGLSGYQVAFLESRGSSSWHGPHQVAQKFNTTTCPWSSASFLFSPVMLFRLKLGVCLATAQTGAMAGTVSNPAHRATADKNRGQHVNRLDRISAKFTCES